MEGKKKLNEFERSLTEKAKIIESALDYYLPGEDAFPQKIHRAMRYSAMAGGKRIRPIMVMEAAKLFGLPCEKVLPTACGIEMIHTYSLIHDDLPVMDNDDYRRGKLTCHKVFGDAIALLAGDALLTHAFLVIAQNSHIEGVSPSAVIDVIEKVSNAAGSYGMVGGQVVDIESSGEMIDEKTLFYMDLHKTGCLIQVSLWSGARLAGASAEDLKAMEDYGEKVGLIFQIVDDILDLKGDEKLLGKPVGSDLRNKKSTFPHIYGLDKSVELVKKLSAEAKDLISAYENSDFFVQLVDFFVSRQY
jgi:geranylgeranyl diphosphate synthase type II